MERAHDHNRPRAFLGGECGRRAGELFKRQDRWRHWYKYRNWSCNANAITPACPEAQAPAAWAARNYTGGTPSTTGSLLGGFAATAGNYWSSSQDTGGKVFTDHGGLSGLSDPVMPQTLNLRTHCFRGPHVALEPQ